MTREEAIECIQAIHVQMFNSGNSKWTEACDMAIEALKEPKQGEWIETNVKPTPFGGYTRDLKCNLCNRVTYEYQPNFCPNCGARMTH